MCRDRKISRKRTLPRSVVAPIASTAEQSRRAFICLQCGDLAESQDEANCSPDPLDARRRAFPTGDVIVWLRRLRTRVSYKQADGIRFPVLRIRPSMKARSEERRVGKECSTWWRPS